MEFLLRNAHERDVASFDLLGPVFVDVLTASASAESLSPTTPCFSVPAPSTHLKAPTKPARVQRGMIDLSFVSEGESTVQAVQPASSFPSDDIVRQATDELLARRFDPDGRGPMSSIRGSGNSSYGNNNNNNSNNNDSNNNSSNNNNNNPWAETSEDDASTDDHTSEIWRRRHEEESSDDGGASHAAAQYVASLSPLEGEKKFDVSGSLKAEFAIPQKASVWRERGVVDSNLVLCEPSQEVRVFWKSSTVLEIVPVGKWHGSTSYCVHVSAGVVSKLEDSSGFTFRFHTQTLRVEMYTRWSRDDPLRPIFKLVPNQAVNVSKLLAGLTLTSRPKGVTGFLMSSVSRFQRSAHTFSLLRETSEFLEIVPVGPLPPNSVVELSLAQGGSYSLEGPNASEDSFSVEFSTYPPLTIVSRHPSYFQKVTPGETLRFNFSNDLLTLSVEQLHKLIDIVPSIPFLVSVSPDSRLCVTPETDAFTTYTVNISGTISDVFGQQLQVPEVFTFTTGQWPPFDGSLKGANTSLLLTHPGPMAPRVFQYLSVSVSQVRERVFVLNGDALPLALSGVGGGHGEDVVDWIKRNGKCVIDHQKSLPRLPSAPDQWNVFDWSPALPNGFGRVCILVEPGEMLAARLQAQGQSPNQVAVAAVIQCTSMAISAVVLSGTCVIAVTRLSDGSPVTGAQVREADGGGKLGVTNQDGVISVTSRLPDKRILAISPTDPSDVCFFVLPTPTGFEVVHAVCNTILDRHLYFPGDVVQCKIWARACTPPLGEHLIKFDTGKLVIWRCVRVYSSDHQVEIASGTALFTSCSSTLVVFHLPADVAPGRHLLQLYSNIDCWNESDALIGQCELIVAQGVGGSNSSLFCNVVVSTMKPSVEEAPMALWEDGAVIATVTTFGHLGGSKLRGAQVKWTAVVTDVPFLVPANLAAEDFVFGVHDLASPVDSVELSPVPLATELGSSGASRLVLAWSGNDPLSRPIRVRIKAVVQDLFQNVASADGSLLILPSAHPIVGIKQGRAWIMPGESVQLECVCVSLQSGKLVVGGSIVTVCLAVKVASGEFMTEEGSVVSVETSKVDGRCKLSLTPKSFGQYRITASSGGCVTTVSLFVPPPPPPPPPPSLSGAMTGAALAVCLNPSLALYHVGQSVDLLCVCSHPEAHGLALVLAPMTGAVLFEQSFRFEKSGTAVLKLAVERRWFPCVRLCVIGTGHIAGDSPWWTETDTSLDIEDVSLVIEVESSLAWQGDRCLLECIARNKSTGALIQGVEMVAVSASQNDFVLAGQSHDGRHVLLADSRQDLLLLAATVVEKKDAARVSGSEESSKSLIDLPEEDLKDARDDLGSAIEDLTNTSSDESSRLALVFVCVEYGGKPFAWVGDAKFEPLALKVIRGIIEPGKRVMRDDAGQFQFVVQRTASNCVAACVISKLAPSSTGFLVLDDVLTRVAMGTPLLLNDVISSWNAKKIGVGSPRGFSPAKSLNMGSFKMSPDHLWRSSRMYGVLVRAYREPVVRKNPAHDSLFCLAASVTAVDGTTTMELANLESMSAVQVVAVSAANGMSGTGRLMLKPKPRARVSLVMPSCVRVGDEFEVLANLCIDEGVLLQTSKCTIVIESELMKSKHVGLLQGQSNRFTVSLQPNVSRYVVAARFVAVSGNVNSKCDGSFSVSVAISPTNDAVSTRASFGILWSVLEEPLCLFWQLARSGALEANTENQTFALSFLGDSNAVDGKLDLKLSRSPMIYLAPAISSLIASGTDMVEVLSSRVLGLCACYSRLEVMDLSPVSVSARIREDVARLLELQGALGGFGQWNRNYLAASSFLSAHAAHALWEASMLFPDVISSAALDRCRAFVDSASRVPVLNKRDVRARAYATFVGVKMGACLVSAAQAQRVAMEDDHSDMDTLGWLLSSVCLSSTLLRKQEEAKKKAGGGRFSFFGLFGSGEAAVAKERETATDTLVARLFDVFDRSYREESRSSSSFDCFATETRGRCVALESVLLTLGEMAGKTASASRIQKKLPELASKILSARTSSGTWQTSHEACFACVALSKYLGSLPSIGDGGAIAESVLYGGDILPVTGGNVRSTTLSWQELTSSGHSELTLVSGSGSHYLLTVERVFGHVGSAGALWKGLSLVRRLEAVDDASDLIDQKECMVLRAGRRFRVVLSLSTGGSDEMVHQLVLRIPLCSALEVLAPRLLQAEWSDHVEIQSDTIIVAAEKLSGRSERTFSFVFRAVHRGKFVLPPAVTFERYRPTFYGRSAGSILKIE